MPSILTETTMPLADVAKTFRGREPGKRLSFSTIWRWVIKGILAPDGHRVRLEAVRLGGKWITSSEALERFSQRLTPDLGDKPQAKIQTPAARRRTSEATAKKLEAMGI